MHHEFISTPIGPMYIEVNDEGALSALYIGRQPDRWPAKGLNDPDRTAEARRQIEEYFAGVRRSFDLRLAPSGTAFQQRVWTALLDIPYGETRSYGKLAASLGLPNASRAVGRANATNPISIIVPCHRVIGASGDLTGYGGGLPNKRWLLEFEGSIPVGQRSLL